MRFLIGCSGALALVAFAIGFVLSLFLRDATWFDRLTMAAIPAIITFIAVLLLSSRDSAKHSATMRSVHNDLLARPDTNDDAFLSPLPFDDTALLLDARKAIAQFFDVPTEKIGRDVGLVQDLHVDNLEPWFQFHVVDSVIASQEVEPKPFTFSMTDLETIDELTTAIRNVLDGFDQSADNENPKA